MRHTTDVEIDSLNDDGALRIIADRWSEGYRPSAEDIQESSATFLSALLQLLERSSIDGIIATGQKSFDLLAEALYRKENSVIESIVRTLERVSADQINASHFILVEACCVYGYSMQIFDRIKHYFEVDFLTMTIPHLTRLARLFGAAA
jgi:hypothetical protein